MGHMASRPRYAGLLVCVCVSEQGDRAAVTMSGYGMRLVNLVNELKIRATAMQ
jgi:hypothetical protein